MSLWGTEVDQIILLVRGAVPAIPAGSVGATRGYRSPQDIATSELPHLLVYNPLSVVADLDFLQAEIRTTYEADLWLGDDQEVAATYRDAIRAAIAANRTLSGTVVDCQLRNMGILEDNVPANARVLVMTFETLRREG